MGSGIWRGSWSPFLMHTKEQFTFHLRCSMVPHSVCSPSWQQAINLLFLTTHVFLVVKAGGQLIYFGNFGAMQMLVGIFYQWSTATVILPNQSPITTCFKTISSYLCVCLGSTEWFFWSWQGLLSWRGVGRSLTRTAERFVSLPHSSSFKRLAYVSSHGSGRRQRAKNEQKYTNTF